MQQDKHNKVSPEDIVMLSNNGILTKNEVRNLFGYPDLPEENNGKSCLYNLYEKGLLSAQTLLEGFGINPDLEMARKAQESKQIVENNFDKDLNPVIVGKEKCDPSKNIIKPQYYVTINDLISLHREGIVSKITLLENLGLDPAIEKSRGIKLNDDPQNSKEEKQAESVSANIISQESHEEANDPETPLRVTDKKPSVSGIFQDRLKELKKISISDGQRPKLVRVSDSDSNKRIVPINGNDGGAAFRLEKIECGDHNQIVKIDPIEMNASVGGKLKHLSAEETIRLRDSYLNNPRGIDSIVAGRENSETKNKYPERNILRDRRGRFSGVRGNAVK